MRLPDGVRTSAFPSSCTAGGRLRLRFLLFFLPLLLVPTYRGGRMYHFSKKIRRASEKPPARRACPSRCFCLDRLYLFWMCRDVRCDLLPYIYECLGTDN